MKIGILTHRLVNNYGGILQAFALSSFLKEQGHDVIFFDRIPNRPYWKRLARLIVNFILGRKMVTQPSKYVKMANFTNKNINMTYYIDSDYVIRRELRKRKIEAMIVGSDQVWRRSFALPYGFNYFLDFVPYNVRKISYAASFGISEWEYTPKETDGISKCLKRFNAVSVREDNAVTMCKDYLNVYAQHVLDPTFLLSQEEYSFISTPRLVQNDYVFVYWLGEPSVADAIIKELELDEGTIAVNINLRDDNEQISVEDWLSYIKYAKYVVTDSFHGCVFSVIFEKQFKVVMNISGGTGRLESLFRMLGIDDAVSRRREIDYTTVNYKLNELRNKSKQFLINALN